MGWHMECLVAPSAGSKPEWPVYSAGGRVNRCSIHDFQPVGTKMSTGCGGGAETPWTLLCASALHDDVTEVYRWRHTQARRGAMATKVDSAGHTYVEFDMSDDEQVRVTYVPHQDW